MLISSSLLSQMANMLCLLLFCWCHFCYGAPENTTEQTKPDQPLSSVTLNISVAEELFGVSNRDLPEMQTFAPYRETGGGFFYSDGTSIYNWRNSSQNSSLLLEYNADITCLHHDQLTYSNCTQTTSAKLGPIAIDYSRPEILYYADGSTVCLVNMFNESHPNLTTNITLDESLGDVTAMAVSDGLFTIQKRNFTHTVSRYDLVSSKPTRSTSWSIGSDDDTTLQAVHLGNGALLCRNLGMNLVLLNTFTGHISPINTGTMYHLPCDSTGCGQTPILFDYLSSYSDIEGQRVYLYGVEGSQKPITLHYNISLVYGEAQVHQSTQVLAGISRIGVIVGTALGGIVVVIGVTIAITMLYHKKKRSHTVKLQRPNQHQRADAFTEGIELREYARTNTIDDEEMLSELGELEEPNTGLSTQRPSPPLPPPRERTTQVVDSGNHAHSDADEHYYSEVIEDENRAINVQAHVHAVPNEPTTPKPLFRTSRDFEKLAIQQSTSNLALSDTVTHRNSKLVNDHDDDNESPYCDNPAFFPETDDCTHVVSVRNEATDIEDPYIEVLENNDHKFNNQAIVREIKHEGRTTKSKFEINLSDEKPSNLLPSNVVTGNVPRENLKVDITHGGCFDNEPPYNDNLQPDNFAPAEGVCDTYVCDKTATVEPGKEGKRLERKTIKRRYL